MMASFDRDRTLAEKEKVIQPARAIMGHCPTPGCGAVVIVINNYEVWPYIYCRYCEESYPTHAIINSQRYEDKGVINNDG